MAQPKANKARLHKVDWGMNSRAIRIPSWAEVMVAPVVGDTNLFMHSCCIIKPETLMPIPVQRMAKSRGRREITRISSCSVSPKNKPDKLTSSTPTKMDTIDKITSKTTSMMVGRCSFIRTLFLKTLANTSS